MGWLNLPVNTAGVGPDPHGGGGAGNDAAPTDWSSFEFLNQFYDALEEKAKMVGGCAAEFPPNSVYWTTGVVDGEGLAYNDSNATFTFSGVAWGLDPSSGCTGSTWVGRNCGECLGNIPADYDLIVIGDYDDPYTWIRLPIQAMTFDGSWPGTGTGTLTTPLLPITNAVTAGFIPSIDSLSGARYRIVKHHANPGSGLTSRDRRPRKPNQREYWRGNVAGGWIDSSGNGIISEPANSIDPSPYDTDGGSLPANNWQVNKWRNKQALFFDSTGLLYRASIAGNDPSHLGFNKSIYRVTVTATGGDFSLSFAPSNGSAGSVSPAFNASASTIQTDFTALPGMAGLVTVSGSNPFTVSFAASLGFVNLNSSGGATVGPPAGAINLSGGAYVICGVGDKGQPGRIPDPQLAWFSGLRQPYASHMPDDSIGTVKKPVYTFGWAEGDVCDLAVGCQEISHDVLGDAQYEIDNNCVGILAGDWLAPDWHKTWNALQQDALGMLGQFVDIWNPWGDKHDGTRGPNMFTPATWAVEAQSNYGISLNAWTSTLSCVNASSNTVSVPSIPVQTWPLSVYYTVQTSHGTNLTWGTAQINSSGGITTGFDSTLNGLTVFLWPGFTRTYRRRHKYLYGKAQFIPDSGNSGVIDPPAITPGGYLPDPASPTLLLGQSGNISQGITCSYRVSALNGSGETNASSGTTIVTTMTTNSNTNPSTGTIITTPTYSVTINWTPELGASSYNVYGQRNGSGGELLMASVSAYSGTWTDDGSITPSGALPGGNTTSTDCFGAGMWNHRDRSQQHLSVTTDGFVNDGGANFSTGVLSRYVGDNAADAFSGRGPISGGTSLDDASYWDRYFRGHHHKALQAAETNHSSGEIAFGNQFSIFDPHATWWTDGINGGQLRVQGGTLTAGGAANASDGTWNTSGTSKACWFGSGRFIGSFNGFGATPWSFFVLEIYSGGTPAGWTIGEDGSATYAAPTGTGHSGTHANGSSPTIAAMTPALLHATGFPQPVFIQGNNFATGCVVTLTAPDESIVEITPTAVTAGELSLSVVFDRDLDGSWTAVAANPGNLSSGSFAFAVHQMQAIPVANFSSGTFTFSATLADAAADGDGYLIREPKYELNRWAGRVVEITPGVGEPVQLVCRYSDNCGLYFDEQAADLDGEYEILEIDTGATMQLSTGKPTVASGLAWCEAPGGKYWVQPAGNDSRMSGAKFRADINCNLETKVGDYGFFSLLDDFGSSIPNELYYCIKSMKIVTAGVGCINKPHAAAPSEYNTREWSFGDNMPCAGSSCSGIWSGYLLPVFWGIPDLTGLSVSFDCTDPANAGTCISGSYCGNTYCLCDLFQGCMNSSNGFIAVFGQPITDLSLMACYSSTGCPETGISVSLAYYDIPSGPSAGDSAGGTISAGQTYSYLTVAPNPCFAPQVDYWAFSPQLTSSDPSAQLLWTGNAAGFSAVNTWSDLDTESTIDSDGNVYSRKIGGESLGNLPVPTCTTNCVDATAVEGWGISNKIGLVTYTGAVYV